MAEKINNSTLADENIPDLPFPDAEMEDALAETDQMPDEIVFDEADKQRKLFEKAIELAKSYGAGEKVEKNARDIIALLEGNRDDLKNTLSLGIPDKKEEQEENVRAAKLRHATYKYSNNIFQRAFSALKMGKEIVWDKIATSLEDRKIEGIKRISHRYEMLKMAADHRKDEYILKMKPKLIKRLEKENKWRIAHNEAPIPEEKIHLLYRESEKMEIRAYEAQARACAEIIERNNFKLEKALLRDKHKRNARQDYIETHKKIASNEYILGGKREVLDISPKVSKKNDGFVMDNTAQKTEEKEEHFLLTGKSQEEALSEIEPVLISLSRSPWDDERNREIMEGLYRTKKDTKERYLPAKYKTPVVTMAYIVKKKLPDIEKMNREEKISQNFQRSSDATIKLIDYALNNIREFIEKADEMIENAEDKGEKEAKTYRKHDVLLKAIQVCPEAAVLIISNEILHDIDKRPPAWKEMNSFLSSIKECGLLKEENKIIPSYFKEAISLQLEEMEAKRSQRKDEKDKTEHESIPTEPEKKATVELKEKPEEYPDELTFNTENKHNKETENEQKLPEMPFPEEETSIKEEKQPEGIDIEKLKKAMNDNTVHIEKAGPMQTCEEKEEEYESPKEIIARKTCELMEASLTAEQFIFTLGKGARQQSYRASLDEKTGEMNAEKYDANSASYAPLGKREMIKEFSEHLKDFQMIVKDLARSTPNADKSREAPVPDKEIEIPEV